jgi:DNA-binding LacI/PurR family transcriptional regulator
LQAAQELNYPLENLRTAPRLHRSALVLTRIDINMSPPGSGIFERSVWTGVHSVLENREIATRLQQSAMTIEEAERYAEDVSISGLVILGGAINRAFIEALQRLTVPFVIAGAHVHPLNVNVVMADVGQGIRQAMDALISRNYNRIAFVNGPQATTTSAEKMDAYRLSLAVHGLPYDENRIAESDFSAERGYQQTAALLERAPDIDAIVFADDVIALGGLRAIRESGRRIPNDLSVIGFGNYELVNYTDPALSSVRFDMRQIGTIAAKRLTLLLDEPDEDGWLVRVPTELVLRDSVRR